MQNKLNWKTDFILHLKKQKQGFNDTAFQLFVDK